MKLIYIIIIAAVSASGSTEPISHIVDYYNKTYNNIYGYLAQIIGIIVSIALGL